MSEEAMSAKRDKLLEQELALRYNRLVDLIRSARYEGVPGAETVATQADATALLEEVRRSHAEVAELLKELSEAQEMVAKEWREWAEGGKVWKIQQENAELRRRVGELEEALQRIAEYKPETHLDRQLDSQEEDASDLEDLEMAAAYSGAFWQVQYLARSALPRQAKPESQEEEG